MNRLALTLAIVSLFSFVVFGCSSEDATAPEPERLSAFIISTPSSVRDARPFVLTVAAVGDRGSVPFEDYDGTVILSAGAGDLSPAQLSLSKGVGSVDATITSVTGRVEITAATSQKTGTAILTVMLDSLPGDPGAPVAGAIPDMRYLSDPKDFSEGYPDLETFPVSHNTLILVFEDGTTVGQANEVLRGMDAGIAGGIPGAGGGFAGILFLKLPVSSHQEFHEAVSELNDDPAVRYVVPDVLMSTDRVPPYNGGEPPDWDWDVEPLGPNCGLERIRAPQMWNLNDAVAKTGRSVSTFVLDMGFAVAHDDVSYTLTGAAYVGEGHGTEVAGVLGADFNNRKGIVGVNPFVAIFAHNMGTGSAYNIGLPPDYNNRFSAGQWMIDELVQLITTRPGIRLVNISIGYNWYEFDITADNDVHARWIADTQGAILAHLLSALNGLQPLPLIVVSAGNDSNAITGSGDQSAKYNSPMTNAALVHGLQQILVVEAMVNRPGGSPGNAKRCIFSDIDGHVSAPGADVPVTSVSTGGSGVGLGGSNYALRDGTSYAAPHVTGLAGYLLAVDPQLTTLELKDLIIGSALLIEDGSPRIDAFRAVVDIDLIRNNDNVLGMLCDVDDGTKDGNTRVDYEHGVSYANEDADGDGGPGDGIVDMSDFRRWRDWLLQATEESGLALDGEDDHPKRDLNLDSDVGTAAEENVFPRGDFNGDGIIDEDAKCEVRGRISDEVTDLEVFKHVFADPLYSAEDLSELIRSADFAFDLSTALQETGAYQSTAEVRDPSGVVLESRSIYADDPFQILTVSTDRDGFRIRAEVGEWTFSYNDSILAAAPGADYFFRPLMHHTLDPRSSFILTCEDSPHSPLIVALSDLDVVPGATLLFEVLGYYQEYSGDIQRRTVSAVFSAGSVLMGSDYRNRVPGAINAGDRYEIVSPRTYVCNTETDISQDFQVSPVAAVIVPEGATHLFIAPSDSWYEDNLSFQYAIQLSVVNSE